jgi:phosphatidylserine/phosphatidylglycerophosphate/cardiolipin synthase-like enzyme
VFYDRRSLEPGHSRRACLHAKVIVRDEVQTLITSANLTEAAQERNVEAGVLLDDRAFARGVVGQFERLVRGQYLVPLSLGPSVSSLDEATSPAGAEPGTLPGRRSPPR